MAFKKKELNKSSGVKISQEKKISSQEDNKTNKTILQDDLEKTQFIGSKTKKTLNTEESLSNKLFIVDPKLILIGIICLILVVIIILVTKDRKENEVVEQVNTATQQVVPELSDEEKLQQELSQEGYGVDAVIRDSQTINTTPVQTDTFLKDLDGKDIPELFEVKEITNIFDFVIYTKHRAVTGEGIELYWLEGKYKGQPCRLTIPYQYFKELPDEGAVICKIEIVQTTEGNKLATNFQFDPDAYNKVIKKSR